MPDATFEMEPGEPLQINVANAPQIDEGAINLHRVYGYCANSPAADCQAELAGLITAFSQEAAPQGPENLRVVVFSDQLAVSASFPDGELLEGFKKAVQQECASASHRRLRFA